MSGHSKWSTIKHKKAAADAKRGRIFTAIIKELTVAAKLGGGDPDGNPRLRTAIADAKAANMPSDNIKRAILKGTGQLPGVKYEEIVYEGYAPGGVAIYVEAYTDNKMRTTPELRHLFSKHGGNLAEPNSVAWMFEKKGRVVVASSAASEERLMEVALEAGAEDLDPSEDVVEIFTPHESFPSVRDALEKAGIEVEKAEIVMRPQNVVPVTGKQVQQCVRLLESLEEHDDVQQVYANAEFDPAELEAEIS